MNTTFKKIIFFLLPLVILHENCKKDSYANVVKGQYIFTVTDSTFQTNSPIVIETHDYSGTVDKMRYRTVNINYDANRSIVRKLDNMGNIIPQEISNHESGKFEGKNFIYHVDSTTSNGWWSVNVVGKKQ